jgi:hypothetical protein
MKGSVIRTVAVMSIVTGAAIASAQQIRVEVDGRPVRFADVGPNYQQGRVLVPVRGVFEDMGAWVQWNPTQRVVTAGRGDVNVTLPIGSTIASVNGRSVALDVPAQIVNGRTMVPLRFISESLGAEVNWVDTTRTVQINTNWAQTPPVGQQERPLEFEARRRYVFERGTVLPVQLDTQVSSRDNRQGDLVRATVRDFRQGPVNWEVGEFDFPENTRVEGRIVTAVRQQGNQPGMVEMEFNRVVMPDGRSFPITGSLIALDSDAVRRNEAGVLVAQGQRRDQRMVYAGYGAGAGLIVGLLTRRPLESILAGGVLGYLVGMLERPTEQPRDVVLSQGTRFGVRLDQPLTVTWDQDVR